MLMTGFKNNPPRAQRGFTLIEILVTVVLISVGLLGVAALQLTTLRGNQEAYVRSQASVIANDILDRMRASPIAFRNGLYDTDFNGTGAASTPAGADLLSWQQSINQLLPGGEVAAAGRIERDALFTNVVTVTIRWTERPQADDPGDDPVNDTVREFRTRSEI
jgi:type IV pilus assembly protein PilV